MATGGTAAPEAAAEMDFSFGNNCLRALRFSNSALVKVASCNASRNLAAINIDKLFLKVQIELLMQKSKIFFFSYGIGLLHEMIFLNNHTKSGFTRPDAKA